MEELCRCRDISRQAVTRGVATIDPLLKDPGATTIQFRSHLSAVNSTYEEIKSLVECIHDTLDFDEVEADLFVISECPYPHAGVLC